MDPTISLPDAKGKFGPFGGQFVPETLMPAVEELAAAYDDARRLVVKRVGRVERQVEATYAWFGRGRSGPARALDWWLGRLRNPVTRTALLGGRRASGT